MYDVRDNDTHEPHVQECRCPGPHVRIPLCSLITKTSGLFSATSPHREDFVNLSYSKKGTFSLMSTGTGRSGKPLLWPTNEGSVGGLSFDRC